MTDKFKAKSKEWAPGLIIGGFILLICLCIVSLLAFGMVLGTYDSDVFDYIAKIAIIPAAIYVLLNIINPTVFSIDADGVYYRLGHFDYSDIYVFIIFAFIIAVLIMSNEPKKVKGAIIAFIVFPVIHFALVLGFSNFSTQDAAVLVGIVIMYTFLFSEQGKKPFELYNDPHGIFFGVFEKATYEDYVVESLNKYHEEAPKKASDSGIYDTTIEADVNMLHDVQSSIRRMAESVEYNKTKLMQLDLVVEEIFVNIASYAYTPYKGNVTVRAELVNDDTTMKVTFIDKGREYNPLAKEDPDVTVRGFCVISRKIPFTFCGF